MSQAVSRVSETAVSSVVSAVSMPAFLPQPFLPRHAPGYSSHELCMPRRYTPIASLSVEARTIAWVRNVVSALNLCPFAPPALDRGAVRVTISRARTATSLRRRVLQESRLLLSSPQEKIETTLVVAPDCLEDFGMYHAFATELQDDLEQSDAEVMLACFHPKHAYADAFGGEEDPVNYDKRAPYPIVNILRTEVVDQAVLEGLTEGILDRNADTLEKVGVKELRRLYRDLE